MFLRRTSSRSPRDCRLLRAALGHCGRTGPEDPLRLWVRGRDCQSNGAAVNRFGADREGEGFTTVNVLSEGLSDSEDHARLISAIAGDDNIVCDAEYLGTPAFKRLVEGLGPIKLGVDAVRGSASAKMVQSMEKLPLQGASAACADSLRQTPSHLSAFPRKSIA